jgi:hypothetical protein
MRVGLTFREAVVWLWLMICVPVCSLGITSNEVIPSVKEELKIDGNLAGSATMGLIAVKGDTATVPQRAAFIYRCWTGEKLYISASITEDQFILPRYNGYACRGAVIYIDTRQEGSLLHYLHLAVEYGLPALGGFLMLFLTPLFVGWRVAHVRPRQKGSGFKSLDFDHSSSFLESSAIRPAGPARPLPALPAAP